MEWYETLKIPLILQLYDISKFFDRENCGIIGKLYRIIFELNRKTVLRVKTGVGLSESTELGENITQGSIGGALLSTVNLDYTVNNHFKTSNYEISYSHIRLQPLIFQDDISRMSSCPSDAQAGNIYIESCMESKLLDLNTDKSCYIVIGGKSVVKNIKCELLSSPLMLCGDLMKEKLSDKYLGDYIHSEGPTASAHCTVSNRYGRIMSGIIEARAIIDDCRVNAIGGLQCGLDFWEIAYLPALLNNCQTWTNISEKTITLLEDLQNTMYRILLNVPRTCPIPALCWEMGGIQMKYRVIMKKLNFLWHLKNLEEGALAKEIFEVQKLQKLPGLVNECSEWINTLKLPNLLEREISKVQWKRLVKNAILEENEADLKTKMKKKEKLKNSEIINEKCETKSYIKNLSVNDARHIFKKKTSMTQYVKMNYMSELKYMKDLWLCDSCQTSIDSMNHVMWCPSYSELRADKDMNDDHDVARYMHDVMMIRRKLDLQK